jgi:hypothetical protein
MTLFKKMDNWLTESQKAQINFFIFRPYIYTEHREVTYQVGQYGHL